MMCVAANQAVATHFVPRPPPTVPSPTVRYIVLPFRRIPKKYAAVSCRLQNPFPIRYDTIEEINVDSKAEYTA